MLLATTTAFAQDELRANLFGPAEARLAEARAAGPGGEPVASGPREVSATITSEPSGAEVRDGQGNVVGVTPAMFVLSVPEEQLGQERTWTLALAGHQETQVSGRSAKHAGLAHEIARDQEE